MLARTFTGPLAGILAALSLAGCATAPATPVESAAPQTMHGAVSAAEPPQGLPD